jgi:D-tyrosyl-tRNA(Tyr) deacylase
MRVVVQRVLSANVVVDSECVGEIGKGLLILLGVHNTDTEKEANWIAEKLVKLRIFEGPDPSKGITLSVKDIDAEVLLVSQFTLYGSTKGNNRPSFIEAAKPPEADTLYQRVGNRLSELLDKPIATGVFGAMMKVNLENDGPFTILIDTATDMPTNAK